MCLLYGKLVHDEKECSDWFTGWSEFCNMEAKMDHSQINFAEFLLSTERNKLCAL